MKWPGSIVDRCENLQIPLLHKNFQLKLHWGTIKHYLKPLQALKRLINERQYLDINCVVYKRGTITMLVK